MKRPKHLRRRLGAVAAVAVAGGALLFGVGTSSSCHARLPLPDPVCTPGTVDSMVTQSNIKTTICVSGYTATVRPPTSYTDTLKLVQMKQYGFSGDPSDYEEDHLVALELGGAPTDPRNLWPEPRKSIKGQAEDKDQVENSLHRAVCAGTMTLGDAQYAIATDWTKASK